MQKDELIQFHMFLLQLKNHLEDMIDNYDGWEFQSYEKLDVSPYQIYKSKKDHEIAIFTLIKGIENLFSNNNFIDLKKNSNKINNTPERFMTKKEKRLIPPF